MERDEKEILTGQSPQMRALTEQAMGKKASPMMQAQLSFEEEVSLGTEILRNARNELYLNMRFLDLALSGLSFVPHAGTGPFYTDGISLHYYPESLMQLYERSRIPVNRSYLHMVLHCLFGHLFGKGKRAKEYWDLACDIAVESILDSLYVKCVHVQPSLYRLDLYQRLKKTCAVLNAESIYRALQDMELKKQAYERMASEFFADDHSGWDEEPDGQNAPERNPKKEWDDRREKLQAEMEFFGKEAGSEAGDLLSQVRIENRERYDYRKFLRKFAVMKETLRVDTDSFDYIYYHYGMDLYGNMPLIEHLETKEEKKIEDFVIVIDTSLSCSGDLVRRFLEQTYGVLSESESFFRKIQVHIIQCDEKVQSDVCVRNNEELKHYMDHMEIRGQGGTDFRPAFDYVDQLIRARAFQKLRGLIYFTDGYGIYPPKMPPYETAFVFWREDYSDLEVPPWAIKLVLGPEDMEKQ